MGRIVTILALLVIQGCASNRYIVDTKGIDLAKYEQDLAECKAYRGQVDNTGAVARSAGAGAIVGAAIGAIVGDSDTAAEIGGAAAVQAGAGKAVEGEHEKDRVVKNCLRQRGYKVLN